MGNIVRDILDSTRLRVLEVAEYSGVPKSNIYRYLKGDAEPTLSVLQEIAHAAGVDLSLGVRPLSDGAAAEAVKVILGNSLDDSGHDVQEWVERITRRKPASGSDVIEFGGQASNVLHRAGAYYFRGNLSVLTIASAGDFTDKPWALSGAPVLEALNLDAADAPTILWAVDAESAARALEKSATPLPQPDGANIVLVPAIHNETGEVTVRGGIRLVSVLQGLIDVISLNDTVRQQVRQYLEKSEPFMASSRWEGDVTIYTTTPESFEPEGFSRKPSVSSVDNQIALTGVYWDATSIDLHMMKQGGVERARLRMRARLPEFIWSAAALEGNTFTLPEVQTLLDGVTVEGKKLEEEQQVLALQDTFNYLDVLVSSQSFSVDQETSHQLHLRVARHEAIEAGHFRGQGDVTGGGAVRLSTGEKVEGLSSDLIEKRFAGIVDLVTSEKDPRLAALTYFAAAIRSQMYFDGNKRTARMMASGILMSHGFDAIYIPLERRLEYNRCLDVLFTTNNATPLMMFIASCF